jgi:hypothetical protein
MLGKLIKYEFKATARMFLFSYLALIVLTLVGFVIDAIGIDGSGGTGENVFLVIYVLLFSVATITVFVITLISVILRFGRNLLGNEGYLMFTLPVSTHSLILSKLIVGIVWFIASVAVLIASSSIIASGNDAIAGVGDLINALNAASDMGLNVWGWLALFCAMVIVSWAATMLLLYGAMSLGPHITKNRVGGSFLAFIILSVGTSVATWAVVRLTGITERVNHDAMQLTALTTDNSDVLSNTDGIELLIDFTNGSFYSFTLASTIASAAVGIVCYFLSHYLLKRKLNLA